MVADVHEVWNENSAAAAGAAVAAMARRRPLHPRESSSRPRQARRRQNPGTKTATSNVDTTPCNYLLSVGARFFASNNADSERQPRCVCGGVAEERHLSRRRRKLTRGHLRAAATAAVAVALCVTAVPPTHPRLRSQLLADELSRALERSR